MDHSLQGDPYQAAGRQVFHTPKTISADFCLYDTNTTKTGQWKAVLLHSWPLGRLLKDQDAAWGARLPTSTKGSIAKGFKEDLTMTPLLLLTLFFVKLLFFQ